MIAVAGLSVMVMFAGGLRVTFAAADLVGSAALVAVIVTVVCAAIAAPMNSVSPLFHLESEMRWIQAGRTIFGDFNRSLGS